MTTFNPQDQLQGTRLNLRKHTFNIEIAKKIFTLTNKNRDHLRIYLDWVDSTTCIEDTLQYLLDCEKGEKEKKKITYGIYLEDELIGNIGVFNIDQKHARATIGYWLDKDHTCKGYMTEAVKIIEKELFEHFTINRIKINCDIENIASVKVAEKCGYTLEGTLRQYHYNPYFDTFRDGFQFSKLKK